MRVSWSLMRLYEHCPFKAKLIIIDKLGAKRIEERGFIRGTTGHKFLESWAKKSFSDQVVPEEAGEIFKDLIRKKHIVWLSEKDKEKMEAQVICDASMIMGGVRCHKLNLLYELEIEKWVSKPILAGKHMMAGLIDMVGERGRWVIETKLSIDPKWIDLDQLIFYGLLLGIDRNKFPSRLSFFLPLMEKKEDRLVDIGFSIDDFWGMFDRVKNVIRKWGNSEFPVINDEKKCSKCYVKLYCYNK